MPSLSFVLLACLFEFVVGVSFPRRIYNGYGSDYDYDDYGTNFYSTGDYNSIYNPATGKYESVPVYEKPNPQLVIPSRLVTNDQVMVEMSYNQIYKVSQKLKYESGLIKRLNKYLNATFQHPIEEVRNGSFSNKINLGVICNDPFSFQGNYMVSNVKGLKHFTILDLTIMSGQIEVQDPLLFEQGGLGMGAGFGPNEGMMHLQVKGATNLFNINATIYGHMQAECQNQHPAFDVSGYASLRDAEFNLYANVTLKHVDLYKWEITEFQVTNSESDYPLETITIEVDGMNKWIRGFWRFFNAAAQFTFSGYVRAIVNRIVIESTTGMMKDNIPISLE